MSTETIQFPHATELSDESLLQTLATGNTWAMEPLYQRYYELLYASAYRLIGQRQLCEELVQEVFVAVWQHASSYSPQLGPVRTWLISLMRHRAIDYLRRTHGLSSLQETSWEHIWGEEEVGPADVWEDVWRAMRRMLVREALKYLPSEQRLMITLAYFEDLTHVQIAHRCKLPLGTVKARIRLGLKHLKRILEPQLGDMLSKSGKRGQDKAGARPARGVVVKATKSSCPSGYELYQDGEWRCFGYTEWEPLVEQIETFEFRGQTGRFMAFKDRWQSPASWYASRWEGDERKIPLGRPGELTLPRLEAMVEQVRNNAGRI